MSDESRKDTRDWRIITNKEENSMESIQSYVDSDNDSDYLKKGLNLRTKGNISHLPKDVQAVIKRQRQKALEQGSVKYIAPLKGVKAKIEVDAPKYQAVERRRYVPVEWYERDIRTGKIIYPSVKCNWIFSLKTTAQERLTKTQELLDKILEDKQNDERNVLKYKYEVNGLKNCKDNAMMMGEKNVKLAAATQHMFFQKDKKGTEEVVLKIASGKLHQ